MAVSASATWSCTTKPAGTYTNQRREKRWKRRGRAIDEISPTTAHAMPTAIRVPLGSSPGSSPRSNAIAATMLPNQTSHERTSTIDIDRGHRNVKRRSSP